MVTFDQHKIDIDELIQQLQLDSINYKHIDKASNNKVVHIPSYMVQMQGQIYLK